MHKQIIGLGLQTGKEHMKTSILEKKARLERRIQQYGSVAVAFSGGVDSTFLARMCHDALGERALAITIDSEAYPPQNIQDTRNLAKLIGIRLLEIRVSACDIPEFSANESDRCYHCKRFLFKVMLEKTRDEGISVLIDGSNADDLGDYRPGKRAVAELGIQSPLQELDFTKDEIRELSRELGLPTWNRQSFACLASRVPYGSPITPELLERTWRAEAVLDEMGFRQYRVRNHREIARIEVDGESMEVLLRDGSSRETLVERLKALGYRYVVLDLQGYRTGSMNDPLRKME